MYPSPKTIWSTSKWDLEFCLYFYYSVCLKTNIRKTWARRQTTIPRIEKCLGKPANKLYSKKLSSGKLAVRNAKRLCQNCHVMYHNQ